MGKYTTAERAVEDKLRVLKDFCIVDSKNEDEYRKVLSSAIRAEPNTQHDIILDRMAKKFISEKFYGV